MTDPRTTLRKIAALKRQKAEQHFQTLQRGMNRLVATLRTLSTKLAAVDSSGDGDVLRILAHQRGHPQRLMARISEQSHMISDKKIELDLAREALKWAIYSQDQI